jgi:hypothetical protein
LIAAIERKLYGYKASVVRWTFVSILLRAEEEMLHRQGINATIRMAVSTSNVQKMETRTRAALDMA